MNILLLLVLMLYLVTGLKEARHTSKLRLKELKSKAPQNYFENGPKLMSTENDFNTIIQNTKSSYVTTNSTTVDILVPITSDIEVNGLIIDNPLKLNMATIEGTMVTGIETITTSSSTSSETSLEIDIMTANSSTISDVVRKQLIAAPVTRLHLRVLLSSSDISFENITNGNVTLIQALAATGYTIEQIITRSRTTKGLTTFEIELVSSVCCKSTPTTESSSLTSTFNSKSTSDSATLTESTPASSLSSNAHSSPYTTISWYDNTTPRTTTKSSSSKGFETSHTKEKTTVSVGTKTTAMPILSTNENTYSFTMTQRTSTETTIVPETSSTKRTTIEGLETTATPVHLTSSGFSSSLSPTAGGHCDTEYSCLNCTTARVCAPTPGGPGLREVTQFPCPDYAPWCDSHSGTCSRLRTPQCDLPVVGNFTCMRDGHFPDPYSCAHYYLCDNDLPLQYTCLYPLPYYSPVSQTCVDRSSDCVDYQSLCQDKSGLKVSVPRVHNLFLYCAHGTVQVVDRCVGAYRFHYEQQACVPECPGAGLFPRDDDCASYYRCSPGPLPDHYTMTNLTCPQGLAFSESAYDCIDRSLVPNCNNSYIS